jgi:two-component system chemotaxis response regulator CheY
MRRARDLQLRSIDDSAAVRTMMSLTLKDAGSDVVETVNGQDALDKLATHVVDLIVTDLNIPVMDRITLIGNARALPQIKYTPILMLTTEGLPEMKQKCREAGATGRLVKLFDPQKLVGVDTIDPALKDRITTELSSHLSGAQRSRRTCPESSSPHPIPVPQQMSS